MPNLIVLTGLRRGTVFPVARPLVIGRDREVEVRLPDFQVSSRHAEVAPEAAGCVLRDLRSTNGTLRNGLPVEGQAHLALGDVIRLGSTELLYSEAAELPPETQASRVRQALVGEGEADPDYAVSVITRSGEYDVRSFAKGGQRESSGLTAALPVVRVLQDSLGVAADLDGLLRTVSERFAQALDAEAVTILLAKGEELEVAHRLRFVEGQPSAEGPEPPLRRSLVRRALRDATTLLAPEAGDAQKSQPERTARQPRSPATSSSLVMPLPSPSGAVGAVYVHHPRVDINEEDLKLLHLLANLAGAHCRAHLLLEELKGSNRELEEARARLDRWNVELQEAAQVKAEELARTERSYRELFEESRDGNFTIDRTGRVEAINRRAAAILGVDPEAALGQPLWTLFGPEVVEHLVRSGGADPDSGAEVDSGADTQGFRSWLEALVPDLNPDVFEMPVLSPGRGWVVVELVVRPLLEADGSARGLHGVVRDVTERVRAEERMRLLTRIVESMPEAVVSITLDGMITSWNPGAEALYGHAADDVMGQLLPTVPDDRSDELEHVLEAVRNGQHLSARTARVTADERRVPVLATYAPVPDAGGRISGMLEIARDLTQDLRDEERARWRDRLASFGEVAAGLAHELGNPLNNLRSGVDFLLARPRDADAARRAHEVMRDEIARLRRLVQQALDLARWEVPALEPLDPEQVLEHLLEVLGPRLDAEEVQVARRPAQGQGLILGALDELTQALLNVLDNALKAAGKGGRLQVGVVHDPESGRRGWRLRDDGPGIAPEDQERVFDMFYSRRAGGSGMGLSIVKRIVDLHGGTVELSSQPGQGASVTILLPLAEPADEEPADEEQPHAAPQQDAAAGPGAAGEEAW